MPVIPKKHMIELQGDVDKVTIKDDAHVQNYYLSQLGIKDVYFPLVRTLHVHVSKIKH